MIPFLFCLLMLVVLLFVTDHWRRRWLLGVLFALFFAGVPAVSAQAPAGFTKLSTTTALTFTDTTCPDMTSCFYVVTAVDAIGEESQPAACATGQLCVNGTQAVAQMPSSGTHTVTLAWVAPTGTGPFSYNLYVHIGPLPPSGFAATVK